MMDDQVMDDEIQAEVLEAELLEAEVEEPRLGEARLLGFYDRLRARIVAKVETRQGKLGVRMTRALLTVPDVFLLLVRLTFDKETPRETRALVGGALAYFVLPLDLFPEGMVGPVGFSEDLIFAAAVVASAFDRQLEALTRRHWSGSEDLRVVLQDLLEAAQALLGKSLYGRLRRLLARRGVRLSSSSSAPS